jgi:hypothetical protein
VLHARDVCQAAGVCRHTGGLHAWPSAQPLDAFLTQTEAALAHDASAALREIGAPTLITFGARDLVCSTRFAEPLTTGIGRSELVVFERLSHAGLPFSPAPGERGKTATKDAARPSPSRQTQTTRYPATATGTSSSPKSTRLGPIKRFSLRGPTRRSFRAGSLSLDPPPSPDAAGRDLARPGGARHGTACSVVYRESSQDFGPPGKVVHGASVKSFVVV